MYDMNDVYLFSMNHDRNRASGKKRVRGVYGCRELPLIIP